MDYSIRLFVYGNARVHLEDHDLLTGAVPVAMQSWTAGELLETEKGNPVMVESSANLVYGELYDVSEKQLKEITKIVSEAGKTAELAKKEIHTDKGATEAYTVTYPPVVEEKAVRVEFGDWKTHKFLQQEEMLYFAYGSCMDDQRLIQYGVDHLFKQVEGRGFLDGYSLGYTIQGKDGGRADIIEDDQDFVEGKVYRVNKEAMEYLFVREGVHGNRYRPAFIDIHLDGKLIRNVLTFIVMDKKEEIAPPEHYAMEILRGAEGLVSDEYYEKLHTNLLDKFQMSVPVEQHS